MKTIMFLGASSLTMWGLHSLSGNMGSTMALSWPFILLYAFMGLSGKK